MAKYRLLLPKMGESVAEATIIKWKKNIGDAIEMDEAIMDIATDKVDSEVPSPVKGILTLKLGNENEVIQVGALIAIIETDEPEAASAVETPVVAADEQQAPQAMAEQAHQPVTQQTSPQPLVIPADIHHEDDGHEEEMLIAQSDNKPETVPSTPVSPEAVPGVDQLPRAENQAVHSSSSRFYSPLVKNIASMENVSQQEMDKIPGTGAEGRLTKEDLLQYVQNRKTTPQAASRPSDALQQPSFISAPAVPAAPKPVAAPEQLKVETVIPPAEAPQSIPVSQPAPTNGQQKVPDPAVKTTVAGPAKTQAAAAPSQPRTTSMSGGDEIIEMDRMRRLIAEHMVMSVKTSPHVTSFVEADVTNIVLWREKNKAAFEKREGVKITYTPIFIEAVAKAIKDLPMINSSVNGTQIIKKKNINIGMATALPSGNLIVPVIRKADELNVVGLTKAVNDLANRARTGKLLPDDVKDGTFTITNVGTFGNVMGTPIINQPQVAILAVGAIKKKPAVIETASGDVIAIRHMMFLSLSYDHRVVDGALGGTFVRKVADYLEAWDINTEL
jgi:2-oxoglutarate dehydrogenase E2 component (dihydrolipoamide succinyltransferase)